MATKMEEFQKDFEDTKKTKITEDCVTGAFTEIALAMKENGVTFEQMTACVPVFTNSLESLFMSGYVQGKYGEEGHELAKDWVAMLGKKMHD